MTKTRSPEASTKRGRPRFRALDRFVQREPWLERDKVMIDSLKTIGIEKGKPFNPDAKTTQILNDAAREAHAWLDLKYAEIFIPPFNEGTHWALPASPAVAEGLMTNFADPDAYPVEFRGVSYSMAYFSAKHLGEGQFYLMTVVDKDGKPLDGGSTRAAQERFRSPGSNSPFSQRTKLSEWSRYVLRVFSLITPDSSSSDKSSRYCSNARSTSSSDERLMRMALIAAV